MRRKSEEVEREAGVVDKYRSHANGNGWVSAKATVHPSAFVSENTYVEAGAEIGAETWIGAGSWIDQGVIVGERVFVGQNVHVGPDSRLGSSAWIGSNARIGAEVRISGGVRLERDAVVADTTIIGPPPAARLNAVAHRVPPHLMPSSGTTDAAPVKRARSRYTRAA
ncbi:DapH/DapD/GlmU-related protein [Cryobacterium melibiosiphilum]|uniref:DapH/DapD/GlmU-related protein n=1 Tax=Cryobacterium melibiosiphilum TaxID=995039 RepID=UPI0013146935|nr:DapH/DapD/GlmU-related protein [Cryobacterium melibiosiphilum]